MCPPARTGNPAAASQVNRVPRRRFPGGGKLPRNPLGMVSMEAWQLRGSSELVEYQWRGATMIAGLVLYDARSCPMWSGLASRFDPSGKLLDLAFRHASFAGGEWRACVGVLHALDFRIANLWANCRCPCCRRCSRRWATPWLGMRETGSRLASFPE